MSLVHGSVRVFSDKIIDWYNYKCEVSYRLYQTGMVAIELTSFDNYEPIAIATSSIPREHLCLPFWQTVIKDYSENQGMLNTLIRNEIVTDPIAYYEHSNSFVSFPIVSICELCSFSYFNQLSPKDEMKFADLAEAHYRLTDSLPFKSSGISEDQLKEGGENG